MKAMLFLLQHTDQIGRLNCACFLYPNSRNKDNCFRYFGVVINRTESLFVFIMTCQTAFAQAVTDTPSAHHMDKRSLELSTGANTNIVCLTYLQAWKHILCCTLARTVASTQISRLEKAIDE